MAKTSSKPTQQPKPNSQDTVPPRTWEYLTAYLSGLLDFPDEVNRSETLTWAGKALSHQLNEYAGLGWEVMDVRWLSDVELMVIFRRRISPQE